MGAATSRDPGVIRIEVISSLENGRQTRDFDQATDQIT